MEFFISSAFAQSGGDAGGGLLGLLPLVLIFVLFYFLLIRPQQKRTKKHKEMVESLQIGDEVVTNGGTLGVIANLDANFIGLEVADRVCIQVQRHAVAQLMPEGSFKRGSDGQSKPKSRSGAKKKPPKQSEESPS